MIKPRPLRKGDKVAVICLSNGILGNIGCVQQVDIGVQRINALGLDICFTKHAFRGTDYILAHPEARAADLKEAFLDDSIKGIITDIGGFETFRTIPYLMEDEEFVNAVREHPKMFLGFSDTTNNHFMFHRLGLQTFYGQSFICDICEQADRMLPYSEGQFKTLFEPYNGRIIIPSDFWYEERTDFSPAAIGTDRISHKEKHGYELLQGPSQFKGQLLGGCIESMGEMLIADLGDNAEANKILSEYPFGSGIIEDLKHQGEIIRKYNIFPSAEEWEGKILFAETSEEQPSPQRLKQFLEALKAEGVFAKINGIIVGKPQNEKFYEEYKDIWREVVDNKDMPILYNVNFGHGTPRAILPYGAEAQVNAGKQEIVLK